MAAQVRRIRFDELTFEPRFEYGEMAQVAATAGPDDGTELGAGMVRLRNARIPWTIKYDEVLLVLEGELRVHVDGQVHQLSRFDSLWLPNGTELIYEAESALVSYAIHPNAW